jgi:hypothetical protein
VRDDTIGSLSWILVLPHNNDAPSIGLQTSGGLYVPTFVRGNLVCPPFRVGLGRASVLDAAVPEATMDEYGHSSWLENEIGSRP